jgi:hypothetical protein
VLINNCRHFCGIWWQSLWGQGLHSFDPESLGGAHHVAPEVVLGVKTQAGAKLHMYYFILTLMTLM